MKCRACGHEHKIMASVSFASKHEETPTFYYCNENDHSCYKELGWHWGTKDDDR